MGPDQFKVIFTGQLDEGVDAQTAAAQLAQAFKIPVEKASKIVSGGKEVTIKASAEHVKAYKIKSALESFGMQIRLQRVSQAKPESKPKPKIEPTLVPEDAAPAEVEAKKEPPKQTQNAPDWSLQPIQDETGEKQEEAIDDGVLHNRSVTEPMPEKVVEETEKPQPKSRKKKQEKPEPVLLNLIKRFGGIIAAVVVGLFILIKKFGLLKILKIGGLATAAAFAGYSPEEACMGNGRCEDTVDDQMDMCWKGNGFDEYDWDNMDETQYMALKPKIEQSFISCFLYEDTGERVFLSPIDLRFDVIALCELTGNSACVEQAEPQLKSCHQRHNMARYVDEDTKDYYQAVTQNAEAFASYFACFKGADGQPLFQSVFAE